MNERIKELVGRAEAYAYEHEEHWHDGPDWQELFNKKFAELIVQECLNQCYYRGMNDELYAGQLKAAAYIEQHFGVDGD